MTPNTVTGLAVNVDGTVTEVTAPAELFTSLKATKPEGADAWTFLPGQVWEYPTVFYSNPIAPLLGGVINDIATSVMHDAVFDFADKYVIGTAVILGWDADRTAPADLHPEVQAHIRDLAATYAPSMFDTREGK
ncbi:MAG TPA: hypothetical protein VM677_27870 [Actinokineospora sp.]|jgi:hypothetical protein|nr:hypothetical protein [Actinokineospora sp.]